MGAIVHFIAQVLDFFKNITGGYGSSIIITTIIIRLILFPLSIKQEQVQRKQIKMQPKLKLLEKKYKGNKRSPEYMKAQRELMKEEGANPILGCLPLVIQLPIFIALYRALREIDPATGLPIINGHFLWFDLTQPDRAFMIGAFAVNILPILCAILQVGQSYFMTKTMNNPHIDKITQGELDTTEKMAKSMNSMMYVMPIVTLFFFYRWASGLNVYYFVTTAFSICQSLLFIWTRRGFYKRLEAEALEIQEQMKKESESSKKSKKSKKSENKENVEKKEQEQKKSLRKTKTKEEIQELRKQKQKKNKKKIMDPLDKKED